MDAKRREAMSDRPNPYDLLYSKFESRALKVGSVAMGGYSEPLHERLQSYAFWIQERAQTGADALLVWDLLDAATALRRAAVQSQPCPISHEDGRADT
jgi:hypothetical protein